jgi:CHASE1-domain containing sensor protein
MNACLQSLVRWNVLLVLGTCLLVGCGAVGTVQQRQGQQQQPAFTVGGTGGCTNDVWKLLP